MACLRAADAPMALAAEQRSHEHTDAADGREGHGEEGKAGREGHCRVAHVYGACFQVSKIAAQIFADPRRSQKTTSDSANAGRGEQDDEQLAAGGHAPRLTKL